MADRTRTEYGQPLNLAIPSLDLTPYTLGQIKIHTLREDGSDVVLAPTSVDTATRRVIRYWAKGDLDAGTGSWWVWVEIERPNIDRWVTKRGQFHLADPALR